MIISELNAILEPHKQKGDNMSTKKTDLLTTYKKWRHQSSPSFENIDKAPFSNNDNTIAGAGGKGTSR